MSRLAIGASVLSCLMALPAVGRETLNNDAVAQRQNAIEAALVAVQNGFRNSTLITCDGTESGTYCMQIEAPKAYVALDQSGAHLYQNPKLGPVVEESVTVNMDGTVSSNGVELPQKFFENLRRRIEQLIKELRERRENTPTTDGNSPTTPLTE